MCTPTAGTRKASHRGAVGSERATGRIVRVDVTRLADPQLRQAYAVRQGAAVDSMDEFRGSRSSREKLRLRQPARVTAAYTADLPRAPCPATFLCACLI